MALTSEQKSSRLFKKSVGAGETLTTRDFFEEPKLGKSAILPSQIWTQAAEIPVPAPVLSNGQTQGVVQYHEKLTLTHVPGSLGKSFYSIDLVDGIPFNYGDGTYNYSLYTSGDVTIPFGQGDWLVDTESGLLTFYANTLLPSGVDANNPPKISFYKYVGLKGLSDISGDITTLSTELSTELVTRSTADASLTNLVSTEAYIRFSGDTVLTNRISAEEVTRSNALSTEISQRISTDTLLDTKKANQYYYEYYEFGLGAPTQPGITIGDRALTTDGYYTWNGTIWVGGLANPGIYYSTTNTQAYACTMFEGEPRTFEVSNVGEATERISTDTVLTNRISTEEVRRSTGLSTELLQRVSTDNVLTSRISSEEVTRSTGLSTEIVQRVSTDTSLTNELSLTTAIAKGAQQAIAFNTYEDMVTYLMGVDYAELNLGQSIYINTLEVPDIWISDTPLSPSGYTYVSDAQLISDVQAGGGKLQIGYATISFLEVQKVDLTNYITQNVLSTTISTEVNTRSTADASLTSRISAEEVTRSTALSTEISQRISADLTKLDFTTVQSYSETAPQGAGGFVGETVLTPTTLYTWNGSTWDEMWVQNKIYYVATGEYVFLGDESYGYVYEITNVTEATQRVSTDTVLTNRISTEEVTRSTALSTEISQRISTDTLLDTKKTNQYYYEYYEFGLGAPIQPGVTIGDRALTTDGYYTWNGTIWVGGLANPGIYYSTTNTQAYACTMFEGEPRTFEVSNVGEATERISTDTVLRNRISTEEVRRSTGLSTELSQRVSTDTILSTALSTETSARLDMAGSGLTYDIDNRLQVNVDDYTISIVNDELRTPETWMEFDGTTTILDNVTNGSTNIVLDYNPVGYISAYINGIEYMVSSTTSSSLGQPFYFDTLLPVSGSRLYFDAVEAGFGLESGVDMIMVKYHYINNSI